MKIGAEVWQFGTDYPGTNANDSQLPLDEISVKAWDEVYWMSTFDRHAAAVSGPAQIAKLVNIYGQQGIDLYLWCVPKGRNVSRMLSLSKACLDVPGVKGLVFDVEPYSGFCAGDCAWLAENLMRPLRASRPRSWLGVTYDPRPQHWARSGTAQWLSYANGASPMVYWRTFAGQGVWADPRLAVTQAHQDLRTSLAPGRDIEYRPLLQGNATASQVALAIDTAVNRGTPNVSLWRRGLVTAATWSTIAAIPEPVPVPPVEPPADCSELEAQLAQCNRTVADATAEVSRLTVVVAEQNTTINSLTDQLTGCWDELAEAKSELATCRTQLQLALAREAEWQQYEQAMRILKAHWNSL